MLKKIIEEKLLKAFSPIHLVVLDDSDKHKGHAAHIPGKSTHFSVEIISEAFCGKSRIQRHQEVYACLAEELKREIHALQVRAFCPQEWSEESSESR